MNRPLIITIGISIILIVLGIWLYLMLFGTPEDSTEVFTNLGFTSNQQPTTVAPPEDSLPIDSLVDTTTGKLRQLTTRPIAGFMATTTSEGKVVRYVERGTGHVYEINLGSGVEKILSRTTIPQVAQAVFSDDATTIALTSFANYRTNVFVGSLKEDSLRGIVLEPDAQNVAFASAQEVLYSISRAGVTTGYRHNLASESRVEVFRFNFAELDVTWGEGSTQTFISTKPAPNLQGFIYTITNNQVTPLTEGITGLNALITTHTIIVNSLINGTYAARAIRGQEPAIPLPLLALREKCTFDPGNQNYLWCAAPTATPAGSYIDAWYKGAFSSDDYFWLINITNQAAELVASPIALTGRSLDATAVAISNDGQQLFFKHKADQTLWVLELI